MTTTMPSSYQIKLGRSLDKQAGSASSFASGSSLVSVKYNFKPPSIPKTSPGYLHSLDQTNSQWSLEYDIRESQEDRRGTRASAQGFQGNQTAGKDVDCVLIWDEQSQAYVLDRIISNFSFKYDRGLTKLSDKAKEGLSNRQISPTFDASEDPTTSVLGLNISPFDEASVNRKDSGQGSEEKDTGVGEDDDDDEDFARQLEMGLEGFAAEKEGDVDSSMEELDITSPQRAKTGLGLLEGSDLREDVITPRGSPYIDRPKSQFGANKSNLSQAFANTARSTPAVSPASITNSPRPTGADSTLSVSTTWKPPAQRSNVAIAYDEDEEEGDEESEEDDDEEDDDEEEEDDGDLDDYARQLESSLQG